MKHANITLLVLALTSHAFSHTWTVDVNGTAHYTTLQEAVNAASDHDRILVMPGTYTGSGSEVVDLLGKTLMFESRDGAAVTIIDGENARRCVLCNSGESTNTMIKGFTLTRGSAYDGGALYLYLSSATVFECIFTNNTQSSIGSGICCLGGEMIVSDCLFEHNESSWAGGAIFHSGGWSFIETCSFLNNTSKEGGAIDFNGTDVHLEVCTFDANLAHGPSGLGGAMNVRNTEGDIVSCSFTQNSATYGGAIYHDNSSISFGDVHIQLNEASILGGAIETFGTFPVISFSTICSNLSDQIHGGWTDAGNNEIADQCTAPCPADLNGDGEVGVNDLLALISAWNTTDPQADVNEDGLVDVSDLLELVGSWGICP